MLTQIINGRILTPQGWLKDGSVLICDGKILEVTNSDLAVIGATVIDARGMTIVPGFVSMHAHGGGGHDFTEATEEAFRYGQAYSYREIVIDKVSDTIIIPFYRELGKGH